MVETLPTSLIVWRRMTDTDDDGNSCGWYAAVVLETAEVNVPSLLLDEKGWENSCVHAKPLSGYDTVVSGMKLAPVHYFNYSGDYKYTKGNKTETVYGCECSPTRLIAWRVTHEWVNSRETVKVSFTQSWQYDYLINKSFVRSHIVTYPGNSSSVTLVNKYPVAAADFAFIGRGGLSGYYFDPNTPRSSGNNNVIGSTRLAYTTSVYPKLALVFSEDQCVFGGKPWPTAVKAYQASAFYDAYQQFPKYSDNNVSNMMEMASLLFDAFRGNFPDIGDALKAFRDMFKSGSSPRKIKSTLGDAWLKYRYVYGTTKADLLQALESCARRQISYNRTLHFNGIYHAAPVGSDYDTVTCRVGFDVNLKTNDLVAQLRHYGDIRGLNLSAYTLWDLIPFSFMVDWIWDVGGKLQLQSDVSHYSDYLVTNVVWSLKYQSRRGGALFKCYTRWYDNNVPDVGIDPVSNDPSSSTLLRRGLDTVSIVPF